MKKHSSEKKRYFEWLGGFCSSKNLWPLHSVRSTVMVKGGHGKLVVVVERMRVMLIKVGLLKGCCSLQDNHSLANDPLGQRHSNNSQEVLLAFCHPATQALILPNTNHISMAVACAHLFRLMSSVTGRKMLALPSHHVLEE